MLDERKQGSRAFQVKKRMDFQQFCKKYYCRTIMAMPGAFLISLQNRISSFQGAKLICLLQTLSSICPCNFSILQIFI